MATRRLCLLLWRALGYPTSLLGLLPVRGWPLQPRPWPAWAAILAVLPLPVFLLSTLLLGYFHIRSGVLFGIWLFILVVERVVSVHGRRALCEAVQCLVLYCGRHPLSARGWRKMLALTLAIFPLLLVHSYSLLLRSAVNVEPNYFLLVPGLLHLCSRVGFALLALCPVALVGALLEDLRHDVTQLLRAPHAATDTTSSVLFTRVRPTLTTWEQPDLDLDLVKGAERWRSLRVRQQLLYDLLLLLKPPLQCCQLCVVFLAACDTVIFFASSIIAYIMEGELKRDAIVHSGCAVASLVLLVVVFVVLDWPHDEVRLQRLV